MLNLPYFVYLIIVAVIFYMTDKAKKFLFYSELCDLFIS